MPTAGDTQVHLTVLYFALCNTFLSMSSALAELCGVLHALLSKGEGWAGAHVCQSAQGKRMIQMMTKRDVCLQTSHSWLRFLVLALSCAPVVMCTYQISLEKRIVALGLSALGALAWQHLYNR